MQVTLSDESLGTLQHVLQTAITDTQKRLAKAKREGDYKRIGLQLADLIALQDIFNPEAPASSVVEDFVVTQDGSVFTFAIQNTSARDWTHQNLSTAPWQWLGERHFAVDHRLAPDLCYQLREAGWHVVVR